MSRVVHSEVLARLQYKNGVKIRQSVLHTLSLSCGHKVFRVSGPHARFKTVLCRECGQVRKRYDAMKCLREYVLR